MPDFDDTDAPLPVNWQLRFIHNQLFKFFQFPSRFCPGPFHSTILRKAEFRSREHKEEYFKTCEEVIAKWSMELHRTVVVEEIIHAPIIPTVRVHPASPQQLLLATFRTTACNA